MNGIVKAVASAVIAVITAFGFAGCSAQSAPMQTATDVTNVPTQTAVAHVSTPTSTSTIWDYPEIDRRATPPSVDPNLDAPLAKWAISDRRHDKMKQVDMDLTNIVSAAWAHTKLHPEAADNVNFGVKVMPNSRKQAPVGFYNGCTLETFEFKNSPAEGHVTICVSPDDGTPALSHDHYNYLIYEGDITTPNPKGVNVIYTFTNHNPVHGIEYDSVKLENQKGDNPRVLIRQTCYLTDRSECPEKSTLTVDDTTKFEEALTGSIAATSLASVK